MIEYQRRSSESQRVPEPFRFVIHGSYKQENWPLVQQVRDFFVDEGLELIAPLGDVIGYEAGFAVFSGEENQDTRLTHLHYLRSVKELAAGGRGFSYFVNHKIDRPGAMGQSQTAEYGYALNSGVPEYLFEEPEERPLPIPDNAVVPPDELVEYLKKNNALPPLMFPITGFIKHGLKLRKRTMLSVRF